jgi:hypothetical protein
MWAHATVRYESDFSTVVTCVIGGPFEVCAWNACWRRGNGTSSDTISSGQFVEVYLFCIGEFTVAHRFTDALLPILVFVYLSLSSQEVEIIHTDLRAEP